MITHRALGESDLIVDLLTRDQGRMSGVARGARASRKRYGGRLQKLVCLDVRLTQRTAGAIARLEDVRIREWFPGLLGDLARLGMAEGLLELAARFAVAGDEGRESFDWLLASWRVIQEGELNRAGFDLALLAFLRHHGMLAPFAACIGCGNRPGQGWFVAAEGGVFCPDCRRGGVAVSRQTLEALAGLPDAVRPEDIPGAARRVVREELRQLVREALRHHAGGELRAVRVWDEMQVTDQNQTEF